MTYFIAFFGIKKAYDMMCRRIAIDQLKKWKIRGNMFSFVSNFLGERQFSVVNNGGYSLKRCQETGVP
jgi:hypothetical protein